MLGPIFVLKLRFTPTEFKRQAGRGDVALPGRLAGARAVDEAPARPRRSRWRPSCGRSSTTDGVDLSGEQQTKTRKALEFFATDARGRRRTPPSTPGRAGGRAPLGVAHVRRALRPAGRPLRRARPRTASRRATRSTCSRAQADASVKVRDGLMDVKLLEQVSDDGLEQWTPVLKASFPLSGGPDVATVLARARSAVAPASRARSYAMSTSSSTCSGATTSPPSRVHKTARRFTVGGCMAELTERARGARHAATPSPSSPRTRQRVSRPCVELGLGFPRAERDAWRGG